MDMKQQRNTRQRQLVLDEVRSRRDHPTAEQIFQNVHALDPHISRGTVYRNLNLLCDNQEIFRVVMSDCALPYAVRGLRLRPGCRQPL